MPIVDPERVQAILDSITDTAAAVSEALHLPSANEVWTAGGAAAQDSAKAFCSVSIFAYLVGQPVVRSIAWILYWISLFIYKFIILEGIYNHGLSQTKEIVVWFWKWQSSLSPQELALEAAVLVSLYGIYELHKYLKRKKYLYRLRLWADRKKRAVAKTYKEGIRRIAQFSIVLAAMASHFMFLGGAVLLRLFIPSLVVAMAHPKFISIFSFYIPVLLTITVIFQYKEKKKEEEERARAEENTSSTTTHRKKKDKRRRRSLVTRLRPSLESANAILPSSEMSPEDELEDWLRFWMTRACVEALKALVSWITPSWFASASLYLELLFYVWIYCLPFIQPDSIAGQPLPEGRPLRVISKFVGPQLYRLVEFVSNAVPLEFWKQNVVGFVSKFLGAFSLVGILSQPTVEWLEHVVDETRNLVIPGITLLTPGFLTSYGVVYVQYILPASKSYLPERQMDQVVLWLQYWVLNALTNATLYHFRSILWWVPLSTHATFLLWCYLSLPKSIEKWYHALELEFKHLGLFPGDHETDIGQTKSFRMLWWVWENIPKASDNQEEGEASTQANSEGTDQVPLREVNVVEGEKDRVSPLSKRKEHSVSPRIVAVDTNTTIEEDDETEYVDEDEGGPVDSAPQQPRMMTRSRSARRAAERARAQS